MNDLNPDRWLERMADEEQERATRESDRMANLMNDPRVWSAWQRVCAGLPPVPGAYYNDEGEMCLPDEDDPEMAEDEDEYADRIDRAATLAEMRWEEDTDR